LARFFDAWMMVPNWERGKTTAAETNLTLDAIVNHIDHICQFAGNTKHCCIGSDLDGGFGNEQTAGDLDSIADLQNLTRILADRGYTPEDIGSIMHGNATQFFTRNLP